MANLLKYYKRQVMTLKVKVTLYVSVKGFTRLGSEKKCVELIDLLTKHDLQPHRYDTSEHTKFVYEKERFIEFWTDMETKRGLGIPIIKGDGFYLDIGWGGAQPYNSWLEVSGKYFSNWEAALNFTKDFYKWHEACYGFVTLYEPYSNKLATPGFTIFDCLPGITWANLFGKPYVDMWGEEKLLNAPACKTEMLDDGGIMLVTADSPSADSAVVAQAEERLRAYLGEEHFYKKPTGEPQPMTLDEVFAKLINKRKEATGYIAPDFKKYYTL